MLIVDGQCMSGCNDRFGGIRLVWRLYLMVYNETSNSSSPVEVLGLQNMTLSGNISRSCLLFYYLPTLLTTYCTNKTLTICVILNCATIF